MAKHHHTGKEGEALAAKYLVASGFSILHTNWRYARYEIDIIAEKDEILHFIEVKTRRSDTYGMPEEAVSDKKLESLYSAADRYMEAYPGWHRIQFDILSIRLRRANTEYFFIEDVAL